MTNFINNDLLQPGETVLDGSYTIEKYLGSGGQGQVYLASSPVLGLVAIKRLHPRLTDQKLFVRELIINFGLRSEHFIHFLHFEWDKNRDEWFSVTEYANNGSLADKLVQGPLSIGEAIKLTIDICQALFEIHEYPYAHGNLKPDNILFHTSRSHELILKLSDLGIAFRLTKAGTLPLSSGLQTTRTALYVAPELLDASVSESLEDNKVAVYQLADIYTIGVILYEMLIGHPPFWTPLNQSEDSEMHLKLETALLLRIREELPDEPKSQRNEIFPSLNALVMKALAKDPHERFDSVSEMQLRLEEILVEAYLRQEAEKSRQQNDKLMELAVLKKMIFPLDKEVALRIEELERAIIIESYYNQGMQAYDANDWVKAGEALRKVIKLDRFHSRSLSMLIEVQKKFQEEQALTKNQVYAIAHIKGCRSNSLLKLSKEYRLVVGVSKDIPKNFQGRPIGIPIDDKLALEVVVRAVGMEILPNWVQNLVLHQEHDSDLIEFKLIPRELGPKQIEIEFLYQRHWLTQIKFEVEVIHSWFLSHYLHLLFRRLSFIPGR